MLSFDEKQKVKDVLSQLNLRNDINMAFFLDKIVATEKDVKTLKSDISTVIHNQKILNDKLDRIIRKIG